MRRVSKRSAERLGCDFYGTENAVTAEGKPSFRSWIFRRGGYVPAGAGLFPALGAAGRSIQPFGGQSGQPPATLMKKRAPGRNSGAADAAKTPCPPVKPAFRAHMDSGTEILSIVSTLRITVLAATQSASLDWSTPSSSPLTWQVL